MDAAACIGCGACIAACPNAAAMLFTSAKISQFALLPHGRPEAAKRALAMVAMMADLWFYSNPIFIKVENSRWACNWWR